MINKVTTLMTVINMTTTKFGCRILEIPKKDCDD